MKKLSESDFLAAFEGLFADVLGFTRGDWKDIEKVGLAMKQANCFKGDTFKCSVAGFVLWFDSMGYLDDDRHPEDGLH